MENTDIDYYIDRLERLSRDLVDLSREVDTIIDKLEREKEE